MAEPLPVRLIAVNDVMLPTPPGVEAKLDRLYVDVLRFQRSAELQELVYYADNFDLRFIVSDRPVKHASLRSLGVQVPSLPEMIERLMAAEIEFSHQRGLVVGLESIVLLDPAGNWVEITDSREVA